MNEQVRELRLRYRGEALERGVSPRDVDLLLADSLGGSVAHLIAHDEDRLNPNQFSGFERQMQRRFAGEPLQYVRGHTEFFSRAFAVDARVLIPRPETELLVERVLELAPQGGRVVDIGTGSGCIAITVELERRDLQVFGCDRSFSALAVARGNQYSLGSRVHWFAADLLSGTAATFDVIVSNPPYIRSTDLAALAAEVRLHEPHLALSPGASGFEVIDRLLEETPGRLRPQGRLLLEIGWGQAETLRQRAEATGWNLLNVASDLAGIPRVATLQRR